MALCINLRKGMTVQIGDVKIDVLRTQPSQCRIAITAPDGVTVLRNDAVKKEPQWTPPEDAA